ncbi:MAG: hypothetical protein RL518_1216 [Pseudomonadota bacterium]
MAPSTKKSKPVPPETRRPRTVGGDTLSNMSDEELLNVRMCDLDISIQGTELESRIEKAVDELRANDLDFKPHFWLSDEWFCADGIPGIAIPFYLAHPRLEKLERSQLLEVEGGDEKWCLKILRHELGHAIENAYRTRRLKARRNLFGRSTEPYPEYYSPRPYSKSFVLHLDPWYAQSHPDEDFAETFAVWITPNSEWRERYTGWPALKKLEYMDTLMGELRGKRAPVHNRKILDPHTKFTKTLREHYVKRKAKYGKEHPSFYDKDLRILFSSDPQFAKNPTAAALIKRRRRMIRATVSRWTGAYQYTTDQVLDAIVQRCVELNLRLTSPEDIAVKEFTVLLTVQTMNYLHSGRHRIAL